MKEIIVEIDGNDGVGKTFIKSMLRDNEDLKDFCAGHNIDIKLQDRGEMTKATDSGVFNREDGHVYFLLDATPALCQANILRRGDSITEKYHTLEDLRYYRNKFLTIARQNDIPVFQREAYSLEELISAFVDRIREYVYNAEKKEVRELVVEKLGKEFEKISYEEFQTLPLFVEGESKEIRRLDEKYGIIYFKPTIYSFTSNRTGIVPGSNRIRVNVSKVLCEHLKKNGVDHSYVDYSSDYVITRIVDNPNIEVVVKANHTGTSKHRYFGMHGSKVRDSHPYFSGMSIENMESYPHPIVRFDWRNPFQHPDTGVQLADEVLCDEQADWFIDTQKAKDTARRTFAVLQDFLNTKDIMIYDLCLFISEDGKTVFGEISPDCGRYRHYNLGSLDKDVWRAGGSSTQVLEKWELLHKMIM